MLSFLHLLLFSFLFKIFFYVIENKLKQPAKPKKQQDRNREVKQVQSTKVCYHLSLFISICIKIVDAFFFSFAFIKTIIFRIFLYFCFSHFDIYIKFIFFIFLIFMSTIIDNYINYGFLIFDFYPFTNYGLYYEKNIICIMYHT